MLVNNVSAMCFIF